MKQRLFVILLKVKLQDGNSPFYLSWVTSSGYPKRRSFLANNYRHVLEKTKKQKKLMETIHSFKGWPFSFVQLCFGQYSNILHVDVGVFWEIQNYLDGCILPFVLNIFNLIF